MSGKKKAKAPVMDHAAPVLRKPKKTDVEKVQLTETTSATMQASPNWSAATDVQAAVKSWNTASSNIGANVATIAQLKDQLKTAESKQVSLRRAWRVAYAQVVSTVNVFSNGSAATVQSFGFDTKAIGQIVSPSAVEGLTVNTGKLPGEVIAAWPKGDARHGFILQHATDPTNAATYSAFIPCTKTKYTLGGSPSGTNVSFRIAPVDPTSASGIGPWSAWTAGTAR
jgi:hypothetical protein